MTYVNSADLASTELDQGAAMVGFEQNATDAVTRTVFAKLEEIKTFEDFGAVGYDSVPAAVAGADSTNAIQNAIDWAHNNGSSARAVIVTGHFFKCGNIVLHPTVTLIGSGRQCSGFVARDNTAGIWFDTPVSAQKIVLLNLLFYANGELGITHIMRLVTGQHGTEGIVQGCWFREAPEGRAFDYNGNVGYVHDCAFESCKFGARLWGNCNKYSTLTFMQIGEASSVPSEAIALEIAGSVLDRLHIEASASGSLPVKMRGDAFLSGLTFSAAPNSVYECLAQIDTEGGAFPQYALRSIDAVYAGNASFTGGIYKVGTSGNWAYYGGTALADAAGIDHARGLHLHGRNFAIKNQAKQALMLRVINSGGVLQHRIGSHTDSSIAGSFHSKVRGASNSLTNTPTGADSSTPFAAGGKISSVSPSIFIFDTSTQIPADLIMSANVIANYGSGTVLTVSAWTAPVNVNGVTRTRLQVQLLHEGTGFSYSSIGVGKFVDLQLEGYLA